MRTSIATVLLLMLWASTASAGPIALVVHPQAGSFDVRAGEPNAGSITGARLGIDVDGQTLWASSARKATYSGDASGKVAPGQNVTACYEFDAPQLNWTVEFQLSSDGTQATVASEIRNRGPHPVKLGRCRLLDVPDDSPGLALGNQPAETVMLVSSGWGLANPVCRISSANRVLTSKTLAPLYNAKAQASILLGFLTFDRINTEQQAEWFSASKKIGLRAYCDFEGHSLNENQAVRSEKLLVLFARDPQRAMATWADAVAAHYRPRIWPKIPAGWLGWAWVDAFSSERYEDVVRRNAAAVSRRLAGFDVEYVWLSLGNLKDVLPGNWLQWNTTNFPTPPDRLAADLRRQGFKLGLWMGAFWMCTHADPQQVQELKDAFLMRNGKPLMAGQSWSYGLGAKLPPSQRPDMYMLDPTHPKTQAFLRKTLETYYRWGVRYYMLDFLYGISGSTPGIFLYDNCHQRNLITGPEVYRAGLKLVREAAGPDTYLLTSTGPTMQNVGLVDACRMGSDYGEGRPLEPGSEFYPGTFIINQATHWTSHRVATDTLATTGFMHRKLFLADTGNVMTVDKPCPLSDAQITATFFGINGGPMMLGDDIDRMTDERLRLVKLCLPRLPEAAYALDLFDCPAPDHPKLFHLPVHTSWDRWDLLALFNYDEVAREVAVDVTRLGGDPTAEYAVWDFWNERFDGICRGKLALIAAPHSVKLVRLSRLRPHPWLLSTDMHVRQGQAEIEDCQWDESTKTLKFRARRPARERGNLFLRIPPGMAAADPRGLWLAKDTRNQSVIARVALEFSGDVVEKSLRFEATKK